MPVVFDETGILQKQYNIVYLLFVITGDRAGVLKLNRRRWRNVPSEARNDQWLFYLLRT